MNLIELKENMHMENVRIFKESFMEYDDYDTSYIITNEENEDNFIIVNGEKLLDLIHNDLKIEHVDDDFCLGIWGDETVRIEYL